MKKLRWGILSTARINRHIIPAILASSRSTLVAVASRERARAESYAAEWKIPKAFGSYEEMLSSPDIDVIYVSLPNHLHAEWTIKAAEAGKHVLCEKPFALTVAEVDRMTSAAKKNDVQVVEAFMYRHHPMTLKVRELIESGDLGEIRFMRGAFSFVLDRPGNIRWLPETGGGALWDIGCYPVSYARMVMGAAPTELFGAQVLGKSGVDLSFAGQMRYANGAIAQIECSFELPYFTRIEIRGSAGSVELPTPFNPADEVTQITITREDKQETLKFHYPQLYLGEVENLADAILDHKPARLPLSETREMIAMLTGLYRSAAEQKPLPYHPEGYSR